MDNSCGNNSCGIYIHIPFCRSKCNYCDFNSYSGREHLAGSYFDALFSEMRLRAHTLEGRPVRTIFIGGGTPTLVDPGYIGSLLELCSKLFDVDPGAEISLESNPGTLSRESLKAYRTAGVNRLSIGLQAWQDNLLWELGRIHDRRQFADNFEAACRAGFRNINVDLIFGLPGQTFEDWAESLEAVTELGRGRITHLSCYSLIIEEGTVFGDRYEAGALKPADDEMDRRMYRHAIDYLTGRGFRHYELSNFAMPGFECRHNIIYWKACEYAGFGAGAHSYLDRRRFSNVPGIEQYITAVNNMKRNGDDGRNEASSLAASRPELFEGVNFIDRDEEMSEFMILGFRLTDGISEREFQSRFGAGLRSVYGNKLDMLVKQGLLTVDKASADIPAKKVLKSGKGCGTGMSDIRYKLTPLGLDLANKVFVEFI